MTPFPTSSNTPPHTPRERHKLSDAGAEHWRSKRKLTLQLLAVWLSSTFLVIFYARELDKLTLFGWPLSYYMAAQGLALVYLALIVIYNRRMRSMEAAYHRAHEAAQRMDESGNHAG